MQAITLRPVVKQQTHWVDYVGHVLLGLIALVLLVFLAAPLLAIAPAMPPRKWMPC